MDIKKLTDMGITPENLPEIKKLLEEILKVWNWEIWQDRDRQTLPIIKKMGRISERYYREITPKRLKYRKIIDLYKQKIDGKFQKKHHQPLFTDKKRPRQLVGLPLDTIDSHEFNELEDWKL